jgi:hypothetical protein
MEMVAWLQQPGEAGLSWPERERELRGLETRESNPMGLVGLCWQLESAWRWSVADLRLLRLAVAWHLGASMPRLEDPMGDGPLEVAPTAYGVHLTSRGDDWLVRVAGAP